MFYEEKENLVFRILDMGRDEEMEYYKNGFDREAFSIFLARNQLLCALLKGVNYMLGELDRMIFPMVNSSHQARFSSARDILIKFRNSL